MAKNKIPTSARYDELVSRDVAKPAMPKVPSTPDQVYKNVKSKDTTMPKKRTPDQIYKGVKLKGNAKKK